MPTRVTSLLGQKFGFLTVIGEGTPLRRAKRIYWKAECVCGSIKDYGAVKLKSSWTRSCGCKKGELANRAKGAKGYHSYPEYNCWRGMKQRCYNKNNDKYHLYGARGIRVCKAWQKSFEQFLTDMGPRPSLKHGVDRSNNNGNYEPSNCTWATQFEQSQNTRRNIWLELAGERRSLRDWSLKLGIKYGCLVQRLASGWSVEKTLTTPILKGKNKWKLAA